MTTYAQRVARRRAVNRNAAAQKRDETLSGEHGPEPPARAPRALTALEMIVFLLVLLGVPLGLWLLL